MIQANLVALLASTASLTDIVGTPASRKDRTNGVFNSTSPKNSDVPQIIYTQVSGNTVPMLSGASNLQPMRVQFSCYGSTPEEAKGLARALKKLLVGYNGSFPDGSRIDYCGLSNELDGYDETPGLWNVPIDLEFLFADTDD